MRRIIIFLFVCLIMFPVRVPAGEMREIEMTDGSIIYGEVLSLAGGIYTIKSSSLGTIKLEESKIRSIRARPAAELPGAKGQAGSLPEKLMNDKEIMSMIESLRDDADFKKILEDPDMMKAVETGDLTKLMADPRFLKLLDNPAVKDIQKKAK